MKFKPKELLLIAALQFIGGSAIAQTPDPEPVPAPKQESVVEKQEVIYDVVEEPADFPGGLGSLKIYIAENLIYPQMALEYGLQGRCFLQFVVSENGLISNIKVKKGVTDCLECDAEAIRMIKSMPKWTPGKIGGKPVKSYFNLPVSFRLN
jgi:periplasmic protein TonB